jgi:salicylate hydroxylase
MSETKSVRDRNGLRIAIVGGGIGGLTLALALRQRGLEADVYEQAPELTEIGAAVALSANSIRELERLGLLEQLSAVSTEPTELIYRDWRGGHRVAAFPVRKDSAYRTRFGAPYFGVHRAEFQRILSGALGPARLHLGQRVHNVLDQGDTASLEFADGRSVHADVVVGADGVRSVVRNFVTGSEETVYSGTSAFRGIVPVDRLPSLPDPQAIQFWMGPNAHLLHYAIGGRGEAVNFFAVVEGPETWPSEGGWQAAVEPDEPVAEFKGWHPAVTEMIDAVPHSVRWGLFVVCPLLHWYRGRVVLVGDSAHGMLPHHGQGANTTIEDAITLAELLAQSGVSEWDAMMRHYQRLRRACTRKIQRSSWATNGLLHLPDGPALEDRNRKVARFPEDFGWIHEFDALQSVSRPGHSTGTVKAVR